MNVVIPNLSFPGAETLAVGPLSVVWLPPYTSLGGDAELTTEDLGFAGEIKAEARRGEFLRSRLLIRKLTGWNGSLAKTSAGGPSWPKDLTGSLTHKDGWIGLTLAARGKVSLGIDAEDVARMKAGFESKILNAAESRRLGGWSAGDEHRRLELLAAFFSVKEALFKAVHPVGQRMFYFPDAEVQTFDPESGRITTRLLIDASPLTPTGAEVEGHVVFWRNRGRHFVLTSVALHGVLNG